MSSNDASPSAAANLTNGTPCVEIFEAKDVEIHRQAGDAIPTAVMVKFKPGAVNFIAKTTHPYTTVSICERDEFDRVLLVQVAYHKKMFNGDPELPRGNAT